MPLGVSGGSGQGTGHRSACALFGLWWGHRHCRRYTAGVGNTDRRFGGCPGISWWRVTCDTYCVGCDGSRSSAAGREADSGHFATVVYARRASGAGGRPGAASPYTGRRTRHVPHRSGKGAHTGSFARHTDTRCWRLCGTGTCGTHCTA